MPKTIKTQTGEVEVPDYIDHELFDEFLLNRKKLKCPNTKRALQTLLNKLQSFESVTPGMANRALEQANLNGWKSVYMEKTRDFNHDYTIPTDGRIL